jgi:hypothetical protein
MNHSGSGHYGIRWVHYGISLATHFLQKASRVRRQETNVLGHSEAQRRLLVAQAMPHLGIGFFQVPSAAIRVEQR